MARTRAFTLVELLTVVAIVAILSAILMPAMVSMRAMAYRSFASQAMGQLATAQAMYSADADGRFMPAFYPLNDGRQAWFGFKDPAGVIHTEYGLLKPYTGNKTLKDASFHAKSYFGDGSGFGYNWAFLGSDFGVTGDYSTFPYCENEALLSDLSNPAKTIIFATSSFYFASWLPDGDGQTYDFGFIDPPAYWYGNPDIDFRFNGTRTVDPAIRLVTNPGTAPVIYCDGHSGVLRQTQVRNLNFTR